MKKILQLIIYGTPQWRICCDLKIMAILMGKMQGFSKHQCLLCKWEGRKSEQHYKDHQWGDREEYRVGSDSVVHEPLVLRDKEILQPLHIKLGLMRNFVRAMDHNSDAFNHLKTLFPKLTDATIEAGEFYKIYIPHIFHNF